MVQLADARAPARAAAVTDMRLGIKGKQVLGVTSIVGAVVVVLSLMHLARLAQRQARGEPRTRGAARRTPSISARARWWPTAPIRTRRCAPIPGLRSILESSLYSKNVTFAAIVDVNDAPWRTPIRRSRAAAAGGGDLAATARGRRCRSCGDLSGQGRNLEFRQPLLLGDAEFGSIRIGVSTLLVRAGPGAVAAARRSLTALRRSASSCSSR